MLGTIGVLVSLVILIVLAYRRWNPMMISIIASVVAGLLNGFGFWETLGTHYIQGVLGFIQSWLLVFTFGAVYSELMIRSGSVAAIAYKFIDWFGKHLLFVMAVITGLLIYGGISSFVVIFILWPMMAVLSKEANIPQRIWIAVFYLGLFAVNSLPNSPSLANIMVPTLLGVSPSSGSLLGILGCVIYFATGYFILTLVMKRYKKQNLGYVPNAKEDELSGVQRKDCPAFWKAILPMIVMLVLYACFSNGWFAFMGLKALGTTNAVMTAMLIACIVCVLLNLSVFKTGFKQVLLKGSMGGINPLITAALISGYVAVVSATPAYAGFINWVLAIPGHPYFQMFAAGSLISMIAGNAAVAAQLVCKSFGAAWINAGVNAQIMRPLLTTCLGGTNILPHSGGLFGILEYTGQNHKESYLSTFLVSVVPTLTTTLILIVIALVLY